MLNKYDRWISIALPLSLFGIACALRYYFFSGFILCDDGQELATVIHMLNAPPNVKDQFHLRFGVWLFNWIFAEWFGLSEFSFFLPTVLMSASLSVIGYRILVFFDYQRFHAYFAGLVIATSPFEVLIGTLRANDLILSWLLAIGLFLFIFLEKKPILQGISITFILWFGFYVKIWVVYLLPILGIYYLLQLKINQWKGLLSFIVSSTILHGISCLILKQATGYYLPFLHYHAATYPVATDQLFTLFLMYPAYLFHGDEFGNTLFGIVPYLLVLGLGIKIIFSLFPLKKGESHWDKYDLFPMFSQIGGGYRLDKLDYWLLSYYGSFFLFINFFTNSFTFEQYYSAPRIFRYLTPLSFPMILHLGKIVLDLLNLKVKRWKFGEHVSLIGMIIIVVINFLQAHETTAPGRTYRKILKEVTQDVKEISPSIMITDAWLSGFFREIYFKETSPKIDSPRIYEIFAVSDYEKWLQKNQANFFPKKTMLLTGLGGCVYYGGHYQGFRLAQFERPLHPNWKLYKEYDLLDYLPIPEPARLWILTQAIAPLPQSKSE